MTWFDWLLVGLWTWGGLVTIVSIGKPKKITTPELAAFIIALDAALIVGLLFTRGVFA